MIPHPTRDEGPPTTRARDGDGLDGAIAWRVVHTTAYRYSEPVPVCHNEVHLAPRDSSRQRVRRHRLDVTPPPAGVSDHTDVFGNRVGFFTVDEPHERLVVTSVSDVEVAVEPAAIPGDRPWEEVVAMVNDRPGRESIWLRQFRLESPLVAWDADLVAWGGRSFPAGRPWCDAVLDLTRRIHGEFVYDPAATTISTPVVEAFALRRGVCQDFAHLQIACLRALGLPARYVSGYIGSDGGTDGAPSAQAFVGAHASHAWISCWGGPAGWIDLDPTNDCRGGAHHVTVAWGRDYGDVCPIKGVYVGGGDHAMDVGVRVERI